MSAAPVPVGSRIRVVAPFMSYGDYGVGDVAVVERIDHQSLEGFRYWVRWESNVLNVERPRIRFLLESEFEVIEPAPERGPDPDPEGWLPVESAPVSGTLDLPRYFIAWLPDDAWGPGGNVHLAMRSDHTEPGLCRPQGSNGDRKFTGWMPLPSRGPKA